MFYQCKHVIINEYSEIKLVCELKSYSIRLIILYFTDENTRLNVLMNESSDIKFVVG